VTFPITRKSAVFAIGSSNPTERQWAVDRIVEAYWKPVCTYVRLKWKVPEEDAQDLTQGFFAVACEKGFFAGYDPGRARFRTFLRVCVDRFIANENKAFHRIKRGGQAEHVALDFEIAASDSEQFELECQRSLFNIALDTLQRECDRLNKSQHFHLFERYDLDETPCTYDELAREAGVSTSDVTNYLAWVRRRFRQIVLELRDQIDPR
jgi:DNA-directed RNA polymerase specialized sigma24 family protein